MGHRCRLASNRLTADVPPEGMRTTADRVLGRLSGGTRICAIGSALVLGACGGPPLVAQRVAAPAASSTPVVRPSEPDIRVLILETADPVSLSGTELALDGRPCAETVTVRIDHGELVADEARCGDGGCRFAAAQGITVGEQGTHPGAIDIVLGGDRMQVIVALPLEQYVARVVAHELPGGWPLEAKKAQAVAARSYAVIQMREQSDRAYALVATQNDQVYGARVDPTSEQAARETRGEVLTADGEVVEAFYHSSCGGHTEDPDTVWPNASARRWATACTTCGAAPHFEWQVDVPWADVRAAFSDSAESAGELDAIEIDERLGSGRASVITLGGDRGEISVPAGELRSRLGTTVLRSTWFDVRVRRHRVRFRGHGFGHGVGMCQWGARGLVDQGHDYRDVLEHYYRETELRRLYD